MIDKNQILSFNHYKKGKPYTGSHTGMRYRISKITEGEEDDKVDRFLVETWPEPFCYEKTDKEKINEMKFVFSQEGYEDVLKYLNELLTDGKYAQTEH